MLAFLRSGYPFKNTKPSFSGIFDIVMAKKSNTNQEKLQQAVEFFLEHLLNKVNEKTL